MFRSIFAVFLGMLVTLAVGLLVLFGIVSPVFDTFVSPRAVEHTTLPAVLLLFVIAFAFYFGGMAASYRAPSRGRLHAFAVVVVLFLVSPAINLLTGREPLPQLETTGSAVLALLALGVSFGAAYVGANRGASLYTYNAGQNRKHRPSRGGQKRKSG